VLAVWIGLFISLVTTITAAWVILFQTLRRQPFIAALAVVLATAASAPLFGFPPQMFTLLLASIFIAVLDSYLSLVTTDAPFGYCLR
jgi:hypothetical protein